MKGPDSSPARDERASYPVAIDQEAKEVRRRQVEFTVVAPNSNKDEEGKRPREDAISQFSIPKAVSTLISFVGFMPDSPSSNETEETIPRIEKGNKEFEGNISSFLADGNALQHEKKMKKVSSLKASSLKASSVKASSSLKASSLKVSFLPTTLSLPDSTSSKSNSAPASVQTTRTHHRKQLWQHISVRSRFSILTKEEGDQERSSWLGRRLNIMERFYIIAVWIPIVISLIYAVAILFPPEARAKAPAILWDNGLLERNENGKYSICPRPSICSEGFVQLFLIVTARLTAFASYVVMGTTFLSKMHCTIHALSISYLGTIIPFGQLHHVHTTTGKWYAILAVVHTIAHLVRWVIRRDLMLFFTQHGISGVFAIIAMLVVVISMSSYSKRSKNMTFEKRFWLHWTFTVLAVALCFHTPRCRTITFIFVGLWVLDYTYGVVKKTHRIDVPELFPLPDESGTQMLWRNPEGFSANSGEYVKINIPWLAHGQHEWHPFSMYLREDTHAGFDEIFRDEDLIEDGLDSSIYSDDNPELSLKRFVIGTLKSEAVNNYLIAESRTSNRSKFNTTQVFMVPAGDWTKQVYKEVVAQTQRRNVWVKGPYVSPYSISGNFNNLVMLATGIGITPALAVMNQYAGYSRFKVLVWSTRSKNMLKFFIPQMKDTHLAIVYYTGGDLTEAEVQRYMAIGNIYIEQKRAHFPRTIDTVVPLCTDIINGGDGERASAGGLGIKEMPRQIRDQWCVLYCGGSKKICDQAEDHCKHIGIHFEYELFDW